MTESVHTRTHVHTNTKRSCVYKVCLFIPSITFVFCDLLVTVNVFSRSLLSVLRGAIDTIAGDMYGLNLNINAIIIVHHQVAQRDVRRVHG